MTKNEKINKLKDERSRLYDELYMFEIKIDKIKKDINRLEKGIYKEEIKDRVNKFFNENFGEGKVFVDSIKTIEQTKGDYYEFFGKWKEVYGGETKEELESLKEVDIWGNVIE